MFEILTVLHERLALPVVVPAAALVPHARVVRLGVFVFDPSRRGGDGNNVEENGEDHQQGYDPPAAGVGDPTAEHDGGGGGGGRTRSARGVAFEGVRERRVRLRAKSWTLPHPTVRKPVWDANGRALESSQARPRSRVILHANQQVDSQKHSYVT